ncbi:MAG: hypothetical protein ACWA40_01695 [Planktomarina sp.]
MNMLWLLRMVRLVKNPPSKERVYLFIGVVLIALGIILMETVWGWPEALTVNGKFRPGTLQSSPIE